MYPKIKNDIFSNCLTISEISQKTQKFNFFQKLYSEFLKSQNVFGNSEKLKKKQATTTIKYNSIFAKIEYAKKQADKNIEFLEILYNIYGKNQYFSSVENFEIWFNNAETQFNANAEVEKKHSKKIQAEKTEKQQKTLNSEIVCYKALQKISEIQGRNLITFETLEDLQGDLRLYIFENIENIKGYFIDFEINKNGNYIFSCENHEQQKQLFKILKTVVYRSINKLFPKHFSDNVTQNVRYTSVENIAENNADYLKSDIKGNYISEIDFYEKQYNSTTEDKNAVSEITKNLKLTKKQTIIFNDLILNNRKIDFILSENSELFKNKQEISLIKLDIKRKILTIAKKSKNEKLNRLYALSLID